MTRRLSPVIAAAAIWAVPAAAQAPAQQGTVAMPGLAGCLAEVDDDDTAAIDACVRANIDEVEAYLEKTQPASDTAKYEGWVRELRAKEALEKKDTADD